MDIDAESVAAARAGVYGMRALQRTSPAQRHALVRAGRRGAEHRISADLRGAVRSWSGTSATRTTCAAIATTT